MKAMKIGMIFLCALLLVAPLVFAKEMSGAAGSKAITGVKKAVPKTMKGAKVVPEAFRVQKVSFQQVILNNRPHLAAAVVFNRNVAAASVKENLNIRLLRKNENHFWVDASTQNNTVRIRPNFITWVSGAPLETGVYRMHLRGTIKSADGVFLDCNGDGVGEGGNLPAYESQLYQATVNELLDIDPDSRDRIKK